jgi:hypothetical protein
MLQTYKFTSEDKEEQAQVTIFDILEGGCPIDENGNDMNIVAYSDNNGVDWVPLEEEEEEDEASCFYQVQYQEGEGEEVEEKYSVFISFDAALDFAKECGDNFLGVSKCSVCSADEDEDEEEME